MRHDITIKWNGLALEGTLHSPSDTGPHPTVVMLQGSGPADRESDGYFTEIRPAFLDRGLATFSFDKPGCGSSTGDWRDHALFARTSQATAVIEALRGHGSVDAERIGVWGHSQGGWLAQMLAASETDLAFAVANSGPSIGVVEQNLYGCEHSMRAEGHGESAIDAALTFVDRLHTAAREGWSYDRVRSELVEPARNEPWYGYADVEDEADWNLGAAFVTEDYDPLPTLEAIRTPFLAVFGAQDVLVPATRGATDLAGALARSPAADTAIVVFPDGDHRIRRSGGDFVAGYLDLIGSWAVARSVR